MNENYIPTGKEYYTKKQRTFEKESRHFKNEQKRSCTLPLLRKDTRSDSNICFTMPLQSYRRVRIIGKKPRRSILQDGSPRNEKPFKQVSFADDDNVYGSTPESSSSESSEIIPYKKYFQQIYQAQEIGRPDTSYQKHMQLPSVDKKDEKTMQPQSKNLPDVHKFDISPIIALETRNIKKVEQSNYPLSDIGLLELSSQQAKEIKPDNEKTKVEISYGNENAALPLTKSAGTSKGYMPNLSSEVEGLNLQSKASYQSVVSNSSIQGTIQPSNLVMDDKNDTSSSLHPPMKDVKISTRSLVGTKKNKTLEGGKAHSSYKSKSPHLVSSIPKPSPYLNRSPVVAVDKKRGVSISGGSGVKRFSGVNVPTETDLNQKKTITDSPEQSSTTKDDLNLKRDENVNIIPDKIDYPSIPSFIKRGQQNQTSAQSGESSKKSIHNGLVKSIDDSSVEMSSFVYSPTKEEENTEIIQSATPLTQGSLKSESTKNISNYSTVNNDPEREGFQSFSNQNIQPYTSNLYENYTNVLAFPGRVDYATSFPDSLSRKNSLDEELEYETGDDYKQEDNKISRSLVEPSVIVSDNDKERLHSIQSKNQDYDKKNVPTLSTLERDLNNPAANEKKTSEPNPKDLEFVGKMPNTFNVYHASGSTAGYETNAFKSENPEKQDNNKKKESLESKARDQTNAFNLEMPENHDKNKMKMSSNRERRSLGDGPKGMIIFVNRNTNGDDYEYSFRKDSPLSKQSLKADDSRDSGRGTLSKIIPYIKSKLDDVRQSLQSNSKDRDSGPSRDFDKKIPDKGIIIERSPSGRHLTKKYPCGCLKYITLDSDGKVVKEELDSTFCTAGKFCEIQHPELRSSDRGIIIERSPSGRHLTKKYPCGCLKYITLDPDGKVEKEELDSTFCKDGSLCEIQHPELRSSDRGIIIERSPSGRHLTKKYPCGCLKYITLDPDGKVEKEELDSTFCKDGSLCEIQHPELRSSDRGIIIERSPSGRHLTKKYPCGCLKYITLDPDGKVEKEELDSTYCTAGSLCKIQHPELQSRRCWFPDIEIVADGIISKKKIPERPPAPTMRGANLTGTINVKSNRLDGICNLYLDPRLIKYLIKHIDEVQASAKEFRQD